MNPNNPEHQRIAFKRLNQQLFAMTMAKVLFTAVVADMRNKLNGTVFSKNRYGGYTRTKVTPVNPQTDAQQAARNNLSTWSQAWRGLTEDQRQSWIDGAINYPFTDIFGNTKVLSGQALYVKLNTNLANAGGAAIDSCPSPVALPALETLSVTAAEGTPAVTVTFTPSPVPADFVLQIFATPNITPGRNFVKNQFRYVATVDAAGTSPAAIITDYAAKFGNPVEDQKIYIRAFFVSKTTGQAGIPLQAMAVVAA